MSAPDDAAALAAAGFDPSAPAPNALAKLRELRTNSAIPSTAIARALGNIADRSAAAMLAEMEGSATGPLRREIRRSLFKLHQRGIDPPMEPPVSAARLTAAADASGLSALLSPIDTEGARIVWITKPRAQGGMIRLWGITSEDEGLVGAIAGNLTRRELRQERGEMERRSGMRLVDADWRLADFLLCEAYRHTPEARRGKVGNFLALRAELIPSPPPTDLQHPIYSELAAEASKDPSLDLLNEPALLEWKLARVLVAPYVEELNRANESTIVLNQMQQQDRVTQIVERAITDLLSAEGGARIRRRFEDIAYQLLKNGKREEAGWAAAAAAKIVDGAELKRVPFFVGFIRMQLGNVVAEEQQRAREEPRLIVTPAEAMRASEARQRRR